MRWVKSSYSFSNGNCAEVATRQGKHGPERLVRDSKDASGPVLIVPQSAWEAFLREVKAGRHDVRQ